MRRIVTVLLLATIAPLAALEICPAERLAALPEDAQEILRELIAVAETEVAEGRAAVAQEREEHLEDLRKDLDRYTRRGDLAAAQAIQARLDALRQETGSADLLAADPAGSAQARIPLPAGEPPPLPSTTARRVASYDKALMRAAVDAAKAIYDEREDARRGLERLVRDLTKGGLLAEAALVKQEHDALEDLYLEPDFLGPVILLPIGGEVVMGDVARTELGATCSGTSPVWIDGVTTGYTGGTGFSQGAWPCTWSVDLGKVYALRQIRLLLWDGNARHYRYTLEASPDGETWAMVADRSAGEWRSWQTIDLPGPQPIRHLRLTGLFNSDNTGFHIVEIEAYCVPPKDAATPRFASVPP